MNRLECRSGTILACPEAWCNFAGCEKMQGSPEVATSTPATRSVFSGDGTMAKNHDEVFYGHLASRDFRFGLPPFLTG